MSRLRPGSAPRHDACVLVVISGLPGSGKTTVARAVAERLGAVHLSIDAIEDALLGAGLAGGWTTGVAAYEAARVVAEEHLLLGRSVVVDAVNDSDPARDTWRRAARAAGLDPHFVTLLLVDEGEHRRRLESRGVRFTNVPEPTWDDVAARAAAYEPWTDRHVVIDVAQPLDRVVAEVLASLPGLT